MKRLAMVLVVTAFLAEPYWAYSVGKTVCLHDTIVLQELAGLQTDSRQLLEDAKQVQTQVKQKIEVYENDIGGSRHTCILEPSYTSDSCSVQYATIKQIRESRPVYHYESRGPEVDKKIEALHQLEDQIEANVRLLYLLDGKIAQAQELWNAANIADGGDFIQALDKLSAEIKKGRENITKLLVSSRGVNG